MDNEASGYNDTASMAYEYPLLLKFLLSSALARAPDQEIVYRDTVRMTYRTMADRVARLASSLAGLGIGKGDTVGVLDWDSHRYLESYFAIPGIGAALHMVNIRLSPEQILYTINHAKDDALFAHIDFLPVLEEIWDRIEYVKTLVLLTDDGVAPTTKLRCDAEYEQMLANASPSYDFPDLEESTRATIFYTTGTTGNPKGVFFSHRQLVLHSLSAATMLGTSPEQGRLHRGDVYMPITPMFHVHAWGVPFVATMLGLKQIYPGRYAPDMLLSLIEKEGVTFSHCVPTLLHMILTHPGADKADLSKWKVIVGGSPLSAGLARTALDRGIDVFVGYGMSETAPILTVAQLPANGLDAAADDDEHTLTLRTRAGIPVPLVEIRIVDADMNPLPAGHNRAGEIVVRSPWCTQAYVGNAEASAALWRGGYLHTGDIGQIHADGYLQITDRTKDVIKTGGEWISSLEIEDLISQHAGVSEVAVISIADERWGERPMAIVVPRSGHGTDWAADLKAHLQIFVDQGALSQWAIPQSIKFVEAIDKTSVGKFDKKRLRERFKIA